MTIEIEAGASQVQFSTKDDFLHSFSEIGIDIAETI